MKEQYKKLKEQPLLAWGFAILLVFIILRMSSSDKPEIKENQVVNEPVTVAEVAPDIAAENTYDKKKAIIDHLMSEDGSIIKDVTWADKLNNTLYVGVIDDGTKRDGFADYVCQVLISDFDMEQGEARVYIMDIVKITRDNEWVQLGKSNCTYN